MSVARARSSVEKGAREGWTRERRGLRRREGETGSVRAEESEKDGRTRDVENERGWRGRAAREGLEGRARVRRVCRVGAWL